MTPSLIPSLIPSFKKDLINNIKKQKKNKLIFIHTPKCAGTYVSKILLDLNITNKEHTLAKKTDEINFTVIRHPVERFESLLNYRLTDEKPREDWPKHLDYVYNDKNIDLNFIIDQMSDKDILGFNPYKSLTFWAQNVDIFLLISELKEFLSMFGYDYDESKYTKVNVSNKNRGTLNQKNKQRIAKLYENDMKLFRLWTEKKY
jgi:hypothetical protein